MELTIKTKADLWRERIASQGVSGQSVRAWCRQNNQRERLFYWWRSRLNLTRSIKSSPESAAGPMPQESGQLEFAEVVVDAMSSNPIACPGLRNAILVLPASMPAESIAGLIRALEGLS